MAGGVRSRPRERGRRDGLYQSPAEPLRSHCSKIWIWVSMPSDRPLVVPQGRVPEAISPPWAKHHHEPGRCREPAAMFFFMVITLFPLGLGPDPDPASGALRPGILWVVALLASLMVSAKLFASDFEDGSLEQLAVAPYPLSVTALAEVSAHWLATGFLLALAVAAIFGVMLGLPGEGLLTLVGQPLVGNSLSDAHWRAGQCAYGQHSSRRPAAVLAHHSAERACVDLRYHGGPGGCAGG